MIRGAEYTVYKQSMKTKKKNTDLRKIWKSTFKTIKKVKGKEQKKQLLAFVLEKFAEIKMFAEGNAIEEVSNSPESGNKAESSVPEVTPSITLLNDLQQNQNIQPENETKTT